MKKTVCELFAGVGGFRVGLENSCKDWKTVWANQWEPSKKAQHAYECYKSHFNDYGGLNELSNIDIAKVNSSHIPLHTLLVGGFPCQDYSVASTGAKGIQGKKGVLWWEINRIVKDKQPPFILLENVDRLLKSPSSQRGRDFGIILACLNNLGYSVEWRIINAAEYGFQQRRKRVFIFASKNNTSFNNIYELEPLSILLNKGFFASTFPIDIVDSKLHLTQLTNNILKMSEQFDFTFENTGYMHDSNIYTIKSSVSAKLVSTQKTIRDILARNVSEFYYLADDEIPKWKYMKGAKAIERISKKGHKYTFREGAIAFPDSLDKPARTMLTSENTKNRSTHVIKDPDTDRLRRLTPVECERINGFPENWTNTGMSESARYFCMGNALVVDLITYMGKRLNKIIENE